MSAGQLRYTGLAAVATLWTTLGAASVLDRFDLLAHRPLSHLGSSPSAALLFGAGLAAAAVLFAAFCVHLRCRYASSASFSLGMLGGMAAQLVTAFVPLEGAAPAHQVHTVSALILGGSLPVFMWRFAVAQPPGPLRRTMAWFVRAEAAACVLGVWLSRVGVAPLAEIVPAAVFHLWVAVLTLWPDGEEAGTRAPARPQSSVEVDGAEVAELVEAMAGVDAAHGA